MNTFGIGIVHPKGVGMNTFGIGIVHPKMKTFYLFFHVTLNENIFGGLKHSKRMQRHHKVS